MAKPKKYVKSLSNKDVKRIRKGVDAMRKGIPSLGTSNEELAKYNRGRAGKTRKRRVGKSTIKFSGGF